MDHPYHVDVEYGLSIGGETRDILVTCEREEQRLRVWAVEKDGALTPADGCSTLDGGVETTGPPPTSGGGLTCAEGYIFQRADGEAGRPDDNACGAMGGCVSQVSVDGQVCGQECDDDCVDRWDRENSRSTNHCGIPIFEGEEHSTTCSNVQMYKREKDGAIFAIIARDQGYGQRHRSQSARAGYYTGASFAPYNFVTPTPMTLTLDGTDLDITVSGNMEDPETAASLLQDAIDQAVLVSVINTADIYGTITFTKNAQGTVDVRANLIWTDESWPVTTTGHKWRKSRFPSLPLCTAR